MKKEENLKKNKKGAFGCLFAILLVGAGIFISIQMFKTAPIAHKQKPAKISALVEVIPLEIGHTNAKIQAMGTVGHRMYLSLESKVGGIIKAFGPRFTSGQIVEKGEPLIFLDDIDQKAELLLAKAALETAQANLEIEIGSQDVAQKELDLLKNSNMNLDISFKSKQEEALALRKPQLAIAKAQVEIAKANLEVAKNNLDYCTIKAPFNAVIDGNLSAIGMHVSVGETLCDLYLTDCFWVDTTVTYENLKWIQIPQWNTAEKKGSKATVYIQGENGVVGQRDAYIFKMRGKLNEGDNMVRLIIEVEDPLALNKAKGKEKLLLSTKVDVVIKGNEILDVYKIPRKAWRNNDQIWLADDENKLQKVYPKLIWKGKENVYISSQGIKEGSRMIISNLTMPIEGLSLSIHENKKGGDSGL